MTLPPRLSWASQLQIQRRSQCPKWAFCAHYSAQLRPTPFVQALNFWLMNHVIHLKLRTKYVTVVKIEPIQKMHNHFHSNRSKIVILSENSCHFVNLISFQLKQKVQWHDWCKWTPTHHCELHSCSCKKPQQTHFEMMMKWCWNTSELVLCKWWTD